MPKVGNKKFQYTRLGLDKAYQEALRTGEPIQVENKKYNKKSKY
tara:strand:+ start:593 stop:724 length:132 start_codon:yes stop_codon:yes gene_type:complete